MKKNIDLARAWRDEDYYLSLTEEERADLGAHPSGASDVADDILRTITGGCGGGAFTEPKPGDETYCNTFCGRYICTYC